jgi:hypothetical protein
MSPLQTWSFRRLLEDEFLRLPIGKKLLDSLIVNNEKLDRRTEEEE